MSRESLSLCVVPASWSGGCLVEQTQPCGWGCSCPRSFPLPLLSEGNFPGLAPKLAWLPPHL